MTVLFKILMAILAKLSVKVKEGFRALFEETESGIEYIGQKISKTGKTKPILYRGYKGGGIKGVENLPSPKGKSTSDVTIVITGYEPPAEAHHSLDTFEYAIASRNCKRWTDEEWSEVVEMKSSGMSHQQIADELNRTKGMIDSKISKMKKKGLY